VNAYWKPSDGYFQVHEMNDGSVKVFWRKALPKRKYAEFAGEVARKCFSGK
jgi:hypothetical protein